MSALFCITSVCNKSVKSRFLSDHRHLTTGCSSAEDDGEGQSHQHCDDRRYRHQRDGRVKGRHGHGPEQAAAWLHCELPQHPVQSAAAGRLLLQKENQSPGNTGRPQVSR